MKILRRVPYLREIALLARRFADAVLEDEDTDAAFDPIEPAAETSPDVPPEKPAAGKGPPAHWLADIAAKAPHLVHDGEIKGGSFTSFDLRTPAAPEERRETSRTFVAPNPQTKQPRPTPTTTANDHTPPNDILNVDDPVGQRPSGQRQTPAPAPRPNRPDPGPRRIQPVPQRNEAPVANKPVATLRPAEKPTAARTAPTRHEPPATNTRATTTFIPRRQSPASSSAPAPAPERKTPTIATPPPQPQQPARVTTHAPTVWPDIPPPIHAATQWPTIEEASPAEKNHASVPVTSTRPEKPLEPARFRPPSVKTALDPIPRRPPAEAPRSETSFVEVSREWETPTAAPNATTNLKAPDTAPLPIAAESAKFYEANDPWPALEPGDPMMQTAPHVMTLELQASRATRLDKEQRGDW